MSKITPGPWENLGNRQIAKRQTDGHGKLGIIATIETSPETVEIYARAIAAVPDLLTALDNLVQAIEDNMRYTGGYEDPFINHDKIKYEHKEAIDALKKAGVFEK